MNNLKNKRVFFRSLIGLLFALAFTASGLLAGPSAPSSKAGSTSPQSPGAVLQGDGTVVSHHAVTLANGRRISYTARAGFLPLRRDDAGSNGELLGEMFFVAYTVDTPPRAPSRPLTFVWDGGPGGSASLSEEGPRRLNSSTSIFDDAPEKNTKTAPLPSQVVENPDTWLDITDLVLIDEMGTGYSRLAKPEYGKLFFSEQADAESFTEFIRIYLRRYDTRDAPIFLKGESYGSIRGVLVSAAAERRGIPIRGMTITALALLDSVMRTDLGPAILFPAFTAAALYHKKLPANLLVDRDKTLHEAESWASGPYTSALVRGNSLSPEDRRTVVQQYARYSGLSPEVIEKYNLRVATEEFANELLRSEGKILGHYDSRISKVSPPIPFNPTTDPSLHLRGNAMPSLLERIYLARELGVNADLFGSKVDGTYLGPFGGAWPPTTSGAWPQSAIATSEWMAVRWGDGNNESYPESVLEAFVKNMDTNRNLYVLFAGGRYDMVTPYSGMDYVSSHVKPDARDRVRVLATESGHDVPNDQLHQAAREFYQEVLAKPVLPTGR